MAFPVSLHGIFSSTSLSVARVAATMRFYRNYCMNSEDNERNENKSSNDVKTHYKTLGVSKSCTSKEIRKAYVELCKRFHPDIKPEDAAQHGKFIELNNAYKTLINPEARNQYDKFLEANATHKQFSSSSFHGLHKNNVYWHNASEYEKPWYETEEYKNQFKRHFAYQQTKQLPQKWIFAGCISLLVIGSLLYLSVYSFTKIYVSRKTEEKSRRIRALCDDAKKKALLAEKDGHLKRFGRVLKLTERPPGD